MTIHKYLGLYNINLLFHVLANILWYYKFILIVKMLSHTKLHIS